MAALVDILDQRGDSYLSWGRTTDVENYRAADAAGLIGAPKAKKPKGFEMSLSAEISAANFFLLQQLIHVSSRSRKKFRGKPWPVPETAADVVKRENAEAGYNALMDEIVFVSQEEFDAHIALHREQVIRREIE